MQSPRHVPGDSVAPLFALTSRWFWPHCRSRCVPFKN